MSSKATVGKISDKSGQNIDSLYPKLNPHPRCPGVTEIPWQEIGRLNKIATKLMKEQGITVLDFNAAITPVIGKYQLPKNCHFRDEGYEFLSQLMAKMIKEELKISSK